MSRVRESVEFGYGKKLIAKVIKSKYYFLRFRKNEERVQKVHEE